MQPWQGFPSRFPPKPPLCLSQHVPFNPPLAPHTAWCPPPLPAPVLLLPPVSAAQEWCAPGMQVNIDFESEQDMVEKARIGLALQPVATALFANSPFRDGKPTGWPVFLN